ncbi:MAG: hypothetical protein N2689_03625 [Verrucomicrobiae bacterium]|nr:hypothetical protein [Verrucomicrobiae bacterium]
MPDNNQPRVNPDDLIREVNALGSKVAGAIDQLVAERRKILADAKAKVAEFDAQIQRLNELYRTANGRYYVPPPKSEEETAEEPRRVRRPRAELEAYAREIVAFLVSRSPRAVSGAEIMERFPDITGGIRQFVEKYAGVKLRDNGAVGTAVRYLPPEDIEFIMASWQRK